MDRFREWLGIEAGHTEEHVEVRRELTEQQSRIRALDAYVEARTSRKHRRRAVMASHPNRRVTDA